MLSLRVKQVFESCTRPYHLKGAMRYAELARKAVLADLLSTLASGRPGTPSARELGRIDRLIDEVKRRAL